MKKLIATFILAAVLLPLIPAAALAQDPPPPNPPAAEEAAAPKTQNLLDIIKTGGWAMWPPAPAP